MNQPEEKINTNIKDIDVIDTFSKSDNTTPTF